MRSRSVSVVIDLDQVRASAEEIRRRTGVPIIAVVKADGYGCGAAEVIDALSAVAEEFAFFSIAEAQRLIADGQAKLPKSKLAPGTTALILGPPDADPPEYRELGLRASVGTIEEAEAFKNQPVAIHVDTGMQRFGLPPEHFDEVRRRCDAVDAYTHAIRPEAAVALRQAASGKVQFLHAAASTLLDFPDAWLDAVRPAIALYRGAV